MPSSAARQQQLEDEVTSAMRALEDAITALERPADPELAGLAVLRAYRTLHRLAAQLQGVLEVELELDR